MLDREMTIKIFVSYRREDTSGHAGRVCDRLRSHFPDAQVFIDVDAIDPGVDFVEVIEAAVGSCDVLLALIGDQWLTACDSRGNRRLDNPEDVIRLEISTALKRGVPVIPVLLEDAHMPTSADMPAELWRLARVNALDISDKRWEFDVGRLMTALERVGSSNVTKATLSDAPPVPRPAAIKDLTTSDSYEAEDERTGWRSRQMIGVVVALVSVLAVGATLFSSAFAASHKRPLKISASAVAPPAFDASGRQVSYEPEQAIDGDTSTAWRAEGDGIGVTLVLDLGKSVPVRQVGLLPGYAKIDALDHTDRFPQNRRIVRVRYRFDGGAMVEQTFADRPVMQSLDVRVSTRRIVIEILETIPGEPDFDYTSISEIRVVTADV